MDIYVGIDPGADGAIVVTCDRTTRSVRLAEFTVNKELDFSQLRFEIRGFMGEFKGPTPNPTTHIVVERLLPERRFGAFTAFRMGFRSGQLQALAQDGNTWGPWKLYTPTPQQWQKAVCRDAGVTLRPKESKQASVAACRKLFPYLPLTWGKRTKAHDGIADAACMARFAYMKAHGLA